MPIIRSGNKIRLTGVDAENYKKETGRASLPTTVDEYNRAMSDTSKAWAGTDCAEGDLLAAVFEDVKIKPDTAQ